MKSAFEGVSSPAKETPKAKSSKTSRSKASGSKASGSKTSGSKASEPKVKKSRDRPMSSQSSQASQVSQASQKMISLRLKTLEPPLAVVKTDSFNQETKAKSMGHHELEHHRDKVRKKRKTERRKEGKFL